MPDQKDPKTDDILTFAAEKKSVPPPSSTSKENNFKLLIVDDEKEIHIMTKLVLADFSYLGRQLEFVSAFSGEEAKKVIKDHSDAALILLDVVMETKDAGLNVAKYIRETAKNSKIRIILRTGQPGKAPEKDIILNYDINDYKEKTELTTQKLFTTVTAALRSFIHLQELEKMNKEIAGKNVRLNEEIARRVMAESNLHKYNRSLEKMIDTKSDLLKQAISALKQKEKELQETVKMAHIGDITTQSFSKLDFSGDDIKANLDTMSRYKRALTALLGKYDMLQNIISPDSDRFKSLTESETKDALKEIDQLKKNIDITQIMKEYPRIIEESSQGIDNVTQAVNDIRLFISISDEPPVTMDINKNLKQAANKTMAHSKNAIQIQTDLSPLPIFQGAPATLEQALYRIIQNAVEAMNQKGIIAISTRHKDHRIIIEIDDTGHGIPKELMEEIFKPYFSTKPGAHGMGLTFANSVINAHNGRIQVKSQPGQGTSVKIILPLAES